MTSVYMIKHHFNVLFGSKYYSADVVSYMKIVDLTGAVNMK